MKEIIKIVSLDILPTYYFRIEKEHSIKTSLV